jgi:hypothetical protein
MPTTDADSDISEHANEQVPPGNTGSTTDEHADDGGKENTNPNHLPPVVTALGATGIRPVGGPVPVAWREGTLTRAYELEALCNWVRLKHPRDSDYPLVTAIKWHLDAARQAARAQPLDPRRRFRIFRGGPLIERATSNLDAAEAQLLNLAPPDYVLGQMPSLLRHVQRHLRPTDPGRQSFERIARSVGINDPDHPSRQNRTDQDFNDKKATIDNERGTIVATVRAASSECLREQLRLRSFRNVVVITAVLMALLAVGVALTGAINKTLVPACFAPQESGDEVVVVCPTAQSGPFIPLQADRAGQAGGTGRAGATGPPVLDIDDVVAETAEPWDLLVVELVGLTAAAIAAAAAISHIRGSSERYGLPVALAALKLPTGAITAFLGLLLMRGQFVPGLSALDSPAQILAWALVFGYAQQLFTRLVDQQGQTVLNSVRSADTPQPSRGPA